ncbi:MAG: glycosyltransferase family 1 protein [Candidatus Riflebacteria bacterium]|nr:glycosyltransferase family 1 protein [Candidatus Riflebacteria bacterium]
MLSPVRFNGLWQRHQAFAAELAKRGYLVFFIEPFLTGGLGLNIAEPKEFLGNLKVITVKVPFKASSFPALQKIAVKFAMMQVLKNVKTDECLLWVAEPSMAEFTATRWKQILYDRCDRHGFFPGQRTSAWRNYEAELYEKADFVSVSHPYLLKDVPPILGKTLIVKNAVSDKYLKRVKQNCKPVSVQDNILRPLELVSAGAHFEWTDFSWLEWLINSENSCRPIRLHIAGAGRGRDFERLINAPNVIFHKKLSHEKLFELLRTCDVGLVPFADTELIRGVDPIKVYEYVACGLQVWAPDVSSLRENPYITHFVGKGKGLPNLSRSCFEQPLDLPTWADRIEVLLDEVSLL